MAKAAQLLGDKDENAANGCLTPQHKDMSIEQSSFELSKRATSQLIKFVNATYGRSCASLAGTIDEMHTRVMPSACVACSRNIVCTSPTASTPLVCPGGLHHGLCEHPQLAV